MKVKLQLTYEVEVENPDSLAEYKKDVLETAEMVYEEGTLTMQVDDNEVEVLDIPVDDSQLSSNIENSCNYLNPPDEYKGE